MKLLKLTIRIMNKCWGRGKWDKTSPAALYWNDQVRNKKIKGLIQAMRLWEKM